MLVNTPEGAAKLLDMLAKQPKYVVYDAETSGLDFKRNHVVGHVLTFGGAPQESFYVPVRHAKGGNLPGTKAPDEAEGWDESVHPWESQMIPLLSKIPKVIGHHLSFDLKFLHRLGLDTTQQEYGDTMIDAYLVNERRNLSLSACCREEEVEEKKGDTLYQMLADNFGGEPKRDQMGNFWRTDGSWFEVHDYAAGDGTSTWQLRKALVKKIKREDEQGWSMERVWEVESKLIPVLHRLVMRGVKVNEEAMHKLISKIEAEFDQALSKIDPELNVRSRPQMIKYFEEQGITNWPHTEKGNASFPEWWLMQNDPGQAIVKVRKFRTLLDSFLRPLRDQHLWNGRVHADYHQTRDENYGTKTGRLSCSDPNLTGQPGKRQADLGRRFREIYIPDEGKRWDNGDVSTCEIRIATHYCHPKVWVDGYAAEPEVDPHTSVANVIGLNRRVAKAINLGLMTGLGAKGLSEQLGIPIDEARHHFNVYFGGLPELKQWQEKSTATYRKRGYVRTLLGRRLRLEAPNLAYRAVNRLTQGGNADYMKAKLVEVDRECGHEVDLLLNIHDDIAWQTDDPDASKRVIDVLENVSNGYIKLKCPIRIDHGYGANWAQATYFEEDDEQFPKDAKEMDNRKHAGI